VVAPFEITHDMPHDIWVAGIAGGDGLSKVVGIRGSGGDQIRHRSRIFPAHEKRKDNGHLQPGSLAHHPIHRRPGRSQGDEAYGLPLKKLLPALFLYRSPKLSFIWTPNGDTVTALNLRAFRP